MRLICGLLRLDGADAGSAAVAAMAAAQTAPGLTPRFGWRAEGPAALAVLDFHPAAGPGPAPAVGEDGCWLAADLRLDRPRALAASLGLPPASPPDILALAALGRFGTGLPDRLDGDYALAAWDPAGRRLTLARDIFGTRPLAYAHLPGRLLAFASLPKALYGSGVIPAEPDVPALVRRLATFYEWEDTTGILDVRWLRPGHTLVAAPGRVDAPVRGWIPDPARVGTWRGSPPEAAETLRALIGEAVTCRLPGDGAAACHLSGGLDSSAVTVFAARALRGQGQPLFAASLLSAPAAGLELRDERPFIEAVLAQEPGILWQSFEPVSLVGDEPDAPDPDLAGMDLVAEPEHAICAAAAAHGAAVLLTGAGGDEGATYNGADIHKSLILAGDWRAVLADLPARARVENAALWRLALRRLAGPLVPPALDRLRHRWRGLSPSAPPPHILDLIRPEVRHAVAAMLRAPATVDNSPEGRVLKLADSYVSARNTWWSIIGARQAVAYSHPLLDRRVVDFMLSLPLRMALDGGWSRQPFRNAMAGVLPDSVRWRQGKFVPFPDTPLRLAAAKPALRRLGAELRTSAAAEVVDFDALDAALVAIPEGEDALALARQANGDVWSGGASRRGLNAVRTLALARRLAAPRPCGGAN